MNTHGDSHILIVEVFLASPEDILHIRARYREPG